MTEEITEQMSSAAERPFDAYASYPEGQQALLAQMGKNVKLEPPFNIIPWKSFKQSLMPLLVKILIDG